LDWAKLTEENHSLAAFWRITDQNHILVVHNLSNKPQKALIQLLDNVSQLKPILHEYAEFNIQENILNLSLNPHQFFWFKGQ
jgi:hypothetical protein